MMDIAKVTAGQMYRYYLRQVVVGDGCRPPRKPLRKAQEKAGVPAGHSTSQEGLPDSHCQGQDAQSRVSEAVRAVYLRNFVGLMELPRTRLYERAVAATGCPATCIYRT